MANYFKSEDVKIFPCPSRTNFNPTARLHTEANLVNLRKAAGRDSFIIDYSNDILKCVVGGYYIEIANAKSYDLDTNNIGLVTKKITYNAGGANSDEDYVLAILDHQLHMDIDTAGRSKFYGICYYENEETFGTFVVSGNDAKLAYSLDKPLIKQRISSSGSGPTHGTQEIRYKYSPNPKHLIPIINTGKNQKSIWIGDYSRALTDDAVLFAIGNGVSSTPLSDAFYVKTNEIGVFTNDGFNNITVTHNDDETSNLNILNSTVEIGNDSSFVVDSDSQVTFNTSVDLNNGFITTGEAVLSGANAKLRFPFNTGWLYVDRQGETMRQVPATSPDAVTTSTDGATSFVTSITQDYTGQIKYTKNTINITSGTTQGSIKVNGASVAAVGLSEQDMPQFKSVTVADDENGGINFKEDAKIIFDQTDRCIKFIIDN